MKVPSWALAAAIILVGVLILWDEYMPRTESRITASERKPDAPNPPPLPNATSVIADASGATSKVTVRQKADVHAEEGATVNVDQRVHIEVQVPKPPAPEPPLVSKKKAPAKSTSAMPTERGVKLTWTRCKILPPTYGEERYETHILVAPRQMSRCYKIRPGYRGRMHKNAPVVTYWSNGAITNYTANAQLELGDIRNAAFKLESYTDSPTRVRVMLQQRKTE